MKVVRFDPSASLIVVPGYVWGPHGERQRLRLAVDTGSEQTTIDPSILDALRYNPNMGEARTIIRSAVASEPGYLLRVVRLRVLGHDFTDFRIHAHDLPDGFGIDGLVGLSVLRQLNVELRFAEGRMLVERR